MPMRFYLRCCLAGLAVLLVHLNISPAAAQVSFSPSGWTFQGEGDFRPQVTFSTSLPNVFCCPPNSGCGFNLDDGQSSGANGAGNAINATGTFHLMPNGNSPRQYTLTLSAECFRQLPVVNIRTGQYQIVELGNFFGSFIIVVEPNG